MLILARKPQYTNGMFYYEVAPTKIIRQGTDSLTYSHDSRLRVGSLVYIEVGKIRMIGLVIQEVTEPKYKTKPVIKLLDVSPLPKQLVDLSTWISKYYKTPLATVLQSVLPRGVDKKRRESNLTHQHKAVRKRTNIVFNEEQLAALQELDRLNYGSLLLQGVTGSGKTEVYKEIARKSIQSGKSIIMLVPEIGLTSQIIDEFSVDFPEAIITHSKMTEAQRHTAWLKALASNTPEIIIGPRSAIFMPLHNIGAIIIDEAHEPSYKQEQAPKYSALRLASILGSLHKAKVIYGTATPAVVDRYLAELHQRPILRLTKPARDKATSPNIQVVDMTKHENFSRHRFLSNILIDSITKNLETNKQTLIFHNRRGSASMTLCENCGWTSICPRCLVPQVLHSDTFSLVCHICAHKEKVPTSCPVCNTTEVIHKGIGTKLIESELVRLFPKARIARFDSDSANDQTVERLYGELYEGSIDIAIGTQVVAKGLDLPKLNTVGVVQADSGLSLPDFGSSERTFQLLAQVIGRVGRYQHQTDVIVQSYQPDHPAIGFGVRQDYESFYKYCLDERRRSQFPPFRFILKLTTSHKTERGAVSAARSLREELRAKISQDVQILGPTPAFYERSGSAYRWQLILKSTKREYLLDALENIPRSNWQYDIDPSSLL